MKKVIFLLGVGFAACAFETSKDETELCSDSLPKSKVCADIEPTQLTNGGNDTIQYVNELLLAQDNKSKETTKTEEPVKLKVIKEKTVATYYHDKFEGRKTASGQVFSQHKLTAAHNSLPHGTFVKVTNLKTNKSVIVMINDRGKLGKGTSIDLSKSAMKKIGMTNDGKITGRLEVKVEQILDNSNVL